MKYRTLIDLLLFVLLAVTILGGDTILPADKIEKVRQFTTDIEFDYINWILNALFIKNSQSVLEIPRYITRDQQIQTVESYLDLIQKISNTQARLERIYSDPNIQNPAESAAKPLAELKRLIAYKQQMGPLAESILQEQESKILVDLGLGLAGQPIPPVLYHVTPLPLALIVSPRNKIQQDTNISLAPELTIEQIIDLENRVEKNLNVSALVVEIGGVGVYPTMVMESSDLPWQIETIAHEWVHNYLTLRPLGLSYESTPELRTMNETTANLAGKEIGLALLKQLYPRYVPEPAPPVTTSPTPPTPTTPENQQPVFDFRAEMHQTRVQVDQLLSESKIPEAEAYMETRRRFFWDHGYQIRRLNQAYFSFYGAYADVPGGAAGSDPVGPAVRKLRDKSTSLVDFLNRISWMTSFDDLKKVIQ